MRKLLLLFIPLVFFFGCEPDQEEEDSSGALYSCYGDGCVEAENGQYNSLNDCQEICDCNCGTVTNINYTPAYAGNTFIGPDGQEITVGAYDSYFTFLVENFCLECNDLTYTGQGCGLGDNPPNIGETYCLEFSYSDWQQDVTYFDESTGQFTLGDMCVSLDDNNIISGPFFSSLAENCIDELECTNDVCFNCTPDGCVETEGGKYGSFEECEEICNCSCGEVIGGEVFPPFEGYVTLNSSGEEIIVGEHPGYSMFVLRNYCNNSLMSTCEDVSLGDTFCGPDGTQYAVSCAWYSDITCVNSLGDFESIGALVQTEMIDEEEITTLHFPFNDVLWEPNVPCP